MMSQVSSISGVILATVVSNLARLFLAGAGGDIGLARQAAAAMLSAYHPQTQPELMLAAETIAFSLQSLEALGQSIDADMPLNKVMRLRGSAVSLNREAHRSHQKLEQMQRSRWTEEAQQAAHALCPAEAAEAPAADLATADMLMGSAAPAAADQAGGDAAADQAGGDAAADQAGGDAAADPAGADVDVAGAVAAVLSPTCATVNNAALDREASLAASDAKTSAATVPPAPAARAVAAGPAADATPPASAPESVNQPAGQAHPAGLRPNAYRGQDCSQPHRKRFLAQQIVENGKRAALQAGATGTGQEPCVAVR